MINRTQKAVRTGLMATSTLYGAFFGLVAPVVTGLALSGLPTTAVAQDLTSGTLSGTVTTVDGKPAADARIVITGVSSGYVAKATTDASGGFRLSQIPLGQYVVEIIGKDDSKSTDTVSVTLGSVSDYSFTLSNPQTVVVRGRARRNLDFDKTTTGMVIDVQALTDKVPLGRDLNALADFVPGVSVNDVFGSPSVSGSSPAENIYYINGMNVTNFRNFLGGTTVPFDFYDQVDVKTGGYSAEFGRSTGGAFVATTKSGSNTLHGGVNVYYTPSGLSESAKRYATDLNTSPAYFRNYTKEDDTESNIWLSGPILKDHIFFYAFYNPRDFSTSAEYYDDTGAVNQTRTIVQKDPFWGGKLDFVLNPNQRVEYTYFTDNQTKYYHYVDAATGEDSPVLAQSGGLTRIVKYTGKFTDWFTLSAMYGRSSYNQTTSSPADSVALILDPAYSSSTYYSGNQNGTVEAGTDLRENYRLDADFYFNLKGHHHLKVGADQENLFAQANTFYSGHIYYRYYYGSSVCGTYTNCVRVRHYESGGGFKVQNNAWYVQDSWDLTDRLNLNLGIRSDTFDNMNASGASFLKMDNQIAPRLGLTYDLFGDKSTKFTAFYGRNYLPIAANTNIRMAGAETYTQDYYAYTAKDANHIPTLGAYLSGSVFSNGLVPDAATLVSQNLDPQYEDEFILGLEHRFDNGWKAGVHATYRKLSSVLEDSDIDYTNACSYLISQGTVASCGSFGSSGYVLVNPGKDLVVTLGDSWGTAEGKTVTIPASELGLTQAKREYQALSFDFQRPWDGKWLLGGSLTLSKLTGNIEGGVKSDNGQDDTGLTQDFDEPGWVDGSNGLLPNHHGYSLKLYGTYAITQKLQAGFTASALSPRKYGCIGYYPFDDGRASGATRTAWYCEGVLTPRASQFSGDWINKVDVNFTYEIPTSVGKVKLTADIFNLFNAQGADQYYETGEYSAAYEYNNLYKTPSSYQTPRSVRFAAKYSF
jgi:hypothetical protein